jgi:hypothetical protein
MPKLQQALPELIKSLKSTYGHDYLNTLTLQMSKITGADYTYIAMVDLENMKAKTTSLAVKGQLVDNFEYSLNNTPCAVLTNDNVCVYPKNICNAFPQDQLLVDMNIEGYVGVSLMNSQGSIIGIIVSLHETEIKEPDNVTAIFELFSGRIAAEIERGEQEHILEQLNITLSSKVNALISSEKKLKVEIAKRKKIENQLTDREINLKEAQRIACIGSWI